MSTVCYKVKQTKQKKDQRVFSIFLSKVGIEYSESVEKPSFNSASKELVANQHLEINSNGSIGRCWLVGNL